MGSSQQEVGDDAEWRRSEGVPSFEEPFIQKYLDGRDALIAQENKQRSDHAFRENLTPMAAEASAIVSAIRFEEQQTLWNREFEDNLSNQLDYEVYPGMMFDLAKERMESSKLWKIIKKMPKGCLLHCHLDAMGDLDWLIEEAFQTEGMHIYADGPLDSPSALKSTAFYFQPAETIADSASLPSIWSSSYQGNIRTPLVQAADAFPDGGRVAFIEWFKSRVTITPHDSRNHHLGVDEVWRKFMSCFPILASLHYYEPIFRKWIRGILSDMHADGVRWVDFRSVFVGPYFQTGKTEPDVDHENMLHALQDEIDNFTNSEEGKGFWGARLIWTSKRADPTRSLVDDMKKCIEMKQLFPDLICGYDVVGPEDLGRPHADMIPELFYFKKKCMEEGVDIPFYFHAGETLDTGGETDGNLFDVILLGTRRIGHGFSLYKHPLLIDMVKDKRILVESCPISNEVLRLTGSILSHPLPALIARGVSCTLCNDDPAILGQGASGMTHDFWQALQGWESLGLEGLAHLAENSVRYASFDDCSAKEWALEIKSGTFGHGIRAQRMKEWAKEWENFCAWVVEEYGFERDMKTLD